jgi:hypothetical protein
VERAFKPATSAFLPKFLCSVVRHTNNPMRAARRIFTSWHEPALLTICIAILSAQLFVPPFIGLADNGDFPKVTGRLSLGPRDSGENFIHFVSDYLRSPRYYWKSETLSTELPLAWLATRLSRATKEGDAFDIRWLGAIHAVLLLGALYILIRSLRSLPRWPRFLIAAAAIFIFTDVHYVSYFNSFYTDAAALLGLLLMVALAVHIAITGMRIGNAILFCLASLLFIGSKPPHAIWGFLPAAFIALAGRRRGLPFASILLAASAVTLWLSPPTYSAAPLFTLVFSKLTRQSPAPQEVLAQLGLPPEDSAFIGMNAYVPKAPILDPKWLSEFTRETGYRAVLNWYFHHPARALEFLDQTLTVEAPQMRALNLSNFRRQDAPAHGWRAGRFAVWSDLRSALLRKWPYHMLVWYLFVIAASVLMIMRTQPALLGWLALGIAVLGIGEFCVAALADAAETYRHLFIFHACTDLTICCGIGFSLFVRPSIISIQCLHAAWRRYLQCPERLGPRYHHQEFGSRRIRGSRAADRP